MMFFVCVFTTKALHVKSFAILFKIFFCKIPTLNTIQPGLIALICELNSSNKGENIISGCWRSWEVLQEINPVDSLWFYREAKEQQYRLLEAQQEMFDLWRLGEEEDSTETDFIVMK